jgi:hypothetical protein
MDDTLVTRSMRIRVRQQLQNRRTRKTQRGRVLCYPKVVRWSGQATPRCQVLLQRGRTRAGVGITQTGLPGSWIREETRITQTGLPGLAVQISSDRITLNRLSGLEISTNNSRVRVSNTQIAQIRLDMRASSGRITQTRLPGLRRAEILKKPRVLLPAKGQFHGGA